MNDIQKAELQTRFVKLFGGAKVECTCGKDIPPSVKVCPYCKTERNGKKEKS